MSSIKAKIVQGLFKLNNQVFASDRKKIEKRTSKYQPYQPMRLYGRNFHIQDHKLNGFSYVVITPKTDASNKKVIYIHGGGFVMEITPVHYDFITHLSKTTGATFYVPIYPVCTKNYSSCLDTKNFICDLYRSILATTDSQNITIMGDSAGGTITLMIGQQLKLANVPAPKNLILISPAVDLSISYDEMKNLVDSEPILPLDLVQTSID
jgi:acetyl esterase/lipase